MYQKILIRLMPKKLIAMIKLDYLPVGKATPAPPVLWTSSRPTWFKYYEFSVKNTMHVQQIWGNINYSCEIYSFEDRSFSFVLS